MSSSTSVASGEDEWMFSAETSPLKDAASGWSKQFANSCWYSAKCLFGQKST